MGILVPEATLPSGIKLSNVYMSFAGEVVFVSQLINAMGPPPTVQDKFSKKHQWQISSHYKVYPKKSQMGTDSNIRVPFSNVVSVIDRSPYDYLYTALMRQYPNSAADIDTWQVQVAPTSNLVIANSTLVSLYKDINSDSKSYIIEPGTSNLTLTVDAFQQVSNVINQFRFQEEEILDEDVPVTRAAALIEESLNASVQE
jgi:hypothetical protein